ncbi:MAG: Fe(3+) ABC transporter substrate-binding protein [Balneolaceae bacterium]
MKSTLFILISLLVFTACSQGDSLNIYTSRHYDTDLELYDRFTEETGISINLIEGGSDELIERISSEGINSPADVVITVDAGRLWRAKEAGVLQSFQSDALNEIIPQELRDDEGYWVGLSQRVRGLVYSTERVRPDELQGYWELGEEQWSGRLCVRSSGNIYNQSLVASLIESHGLEETEAWAERLVSNFARAPQGGDTDQIKAVAAGLCDVALVNHYYLARLINSDQASDREVAQQVAIFFPPSEFGGTHVNISGAGIAKYAPNYDHAVRFIEYLATPDAQALFSVGNMEFPISDKVELPTVLEQFGDFQSDLVNVSSYGENNPAAVRLMDRAGWR